MKKLIDLISEELRAAFAECGYEERFGNASVSNRPDLCQYQCNGAMAAAKQYKKAPIMIANELVEKLNGCSMFAKIEAVMPGFINIDLNPEFVCDYLRKMAADERLGADSAAEPKSMVVDYGGANVAKPLHVGHLRPAIIGESIKRILKFMGHQVVGDAHLGDWGLQMGLIIAYMEEREPELSYFDKGFTGEYPAEAPFTASELEQIYPTASKRSKEDEAFLKKAQTAVYELQNGNRGYYALWEHIINLSVPDIKRLYDKLNVFFELWKKESDAQPYIPDMIKYMKDEGFAYISEGALVVDVKEETDTKEVPPCMLLKSNGATLYDTTDLATIVERVKLFDPKHIIYVVDKRQELYFERIFRCAKKTRLVGDDVKLTFIGFGTMNGSDGKPFKTRDGGVMRLDNLIQSVSDAVYNKIMSNREMAEDEAREVAEKVGLAALKYGDLSNQATKDYVFDVDRFTAFEGNTGPYLLYTMVRIKSILAKYKEMGGNVCDVIPEGNRDNRPDSEQKLMLICSRFNDMVEHAAEELAPHKVCQYLYEIADGFNTFYHENKIIAENNKDTQAAWIALIALVLKIMETCIGFLGIEAPDRM